MLSAEEAQGVSPLAEQGGQTFNTAALAQL